MKENTLFLYSPAHVVIGRIVFNGTNFEVLVDKSRPCLLEELKSLLANARQNGVVAKKAKRIQNPDGKELVTDFAEVVRIGDETFFATVKDVINGTKTFTEGRVFALIPRENKGGCHVA